MEVPSSHTVNKPRSKSVSRSSVQLNRQLKMAKCLKDQSCSLICANKSCTETAIMCSNRQCACHKIHSGLCLKIEPDNITNELLKWRFLSQQFEQNLEKTLAALIREVQVLKQDLQGLVQSVGQTQSQRQFIKMVRDAQFEQLTGSLVGQVHEDLADRGLQTDRHHLEQKINQEWNSQLIQINKDLRKVRKIFSKKHIAQLETGSQVTTTFEKIQGHSSILESQEQVDSLIKMFPSPQSVDHLSQLFKASAHDFDVSAFHAACDNIGHTVTLIRTEYNKVIGGYTPVEWTSHPTGICASDPSHTSFLFSLTNNDKLLMKPINGTLYHRRNNGPWFYGGNDLKVSDSANQNRSSYANIGHFYVNQNYKYNDSESWVRFSGSKDGRFKILEWEVYRVVFKKGV